MKEKKEKEEDKKKAKVTQENHTYAYQEFLAVNNMQIEDLPEEIQILVKAIDKQLRKAKIHCTTAHYNYIKKSLQEFANMAEELLYRHFDQQIIGNQIEEKKKEEKEDISPSLMEKILAKAEKVDRNFLYTAELWNLGITDTTDYKTIEVGDILLYRESGTERWYVGVNKKKEDQG